jgi:hypothetical protein
MTKPMILMAVERIEGGDGRRRLNNHYVRRMNGRSYKGKRKVNLCFFFPSLVCFSSIGVVIF